VHFMEGVDARVAWMGDCGILDPMTTRTDSHPPEPGAAQDALGRGVYDAAEAVRLLNFQRDSTPMRRLQTRTLYRWMRGYDYVAGDEMRHAAPLWEPDYEPAGADDNNRALLEISFRDLIELRFVNAFRALGLPLPAIRICLLRAIDVIGDSRPFSTRKFRTDGKTIFVDITSDLPDGAMIDLKSRQHVFRHVVAPSLKDLEFEADSVARWFPLGLDRRSVVIDPARAFGRPVATESGIPAEVLADAVAVEGSVADAARAYEVPISVVKDAVRFRERLVA